MSFFRARRSSTIYVAVVNDEIERLDLRIRGIAAVHCLASITDDDVLHDSPDYVVENRDAEE
jgi:hypothetical protein